MNEPAPAYIPLLEFMYDYGSQEVYSVDELAKQFGLKTIVQAANARCITETRIGHFTKLRAHGVDVVVAHRRLLEIEIEENADLESVNTKMLGVGAKLVDQTTQEFLKKLSEKRCRTAYFDQPHPPSQAELEDVFRT